MKTIDNDNKENEVNNLPIPLPEILETKYRQVETEFFSLLQSGELQKAFDIWNEYYSLLLNKQPSSKRFHKGGPLHNMGITKLFTNATVAALRLFTLAYIEDVLSETKQFSNDIAPAPITLQDVFKLTKNDLLLIRENINKLVVEKGVVQNPQDILNEFSKSEREHEIQRYASGLSLLIKQRFSISRIPNYWEKRVFIGGDYSRISELIKIKKFVQDRGYEPILALEFKIPTDLIHHHSLLLLHNCKYAIFDIATRGGQFMEAERTFDYRNETIFISNNALYSKVSDMISTFGIAIKTYKDDITLKNLIEEFLPI